MTEGPHTDPGLDAAPALCGGRYRLLRVLGGGGMALVYEAWDCRLAVHRAIKVLRASMANSPEIVRRFETEAQTMARLRHPNIVNVFDVGTDQGRAFIVMELVGGGSLGQRVKQLGPCPESLAAQSMEAVLAALSVAHQAGVVHRDIKPHNILLDLDGTPKVTDFGIAHLIDGDTDALTKTGAVLGTWSYMAPEQRESSRRVTALADVYAAGATLYYLCTARKPAELFAAEHDVVVRADRFTGVSSGMTSVILDATRYRAERRHPSASAMRDALAAFRADLEPVSSHWLCESLSNTASPPAGPTLPTGFDGSFTEESAFPNTGRSDVWSDPTPPRAAELSPTRGVRLAAVLVLGAGLVVAVMGHKLDLESWATGDTEPDPMRTPVEGARPPSLPPPEPPEETVPSEPEEPQVVEDAASERMADGPPAVASQAPARPAESTPPAPAAVLGRLMLNTLPWSDVTSGGQALGRTPVEWEAPVGRHEVVFTRPDGTEHAATLTVAEGDAGRYCYDFVAEGRCQR